MSNHENNEPNLKKFLYLLVACLFRLIFVFVLYGNLDVCLSASSGTCGMDMKDDEDQSQSVMPFQDCGLSNSPIHGKLLVNYFQDFFSHSFAWLLK